MTKEEDYIWRTVGGRRIKIYVGQSLEEAMQKSGKFTLKKDYSKFEIKLEQNKRQIKNLNGEEIEMLSSKEYNKIAEDFANSLTNEELALVQDYVDCPGISGDLNASEYGAGRKYLYNTTNEEYFISRNQLAKAEINMLKELQQKIEITDGLSYEDYYKPEINKWFKENKIYDYDDARNFIYRAEESKYYSKDEIVKAEKIYKEIQPLEQKRLNYSYDTKEYKELKDIETQIRKKYGIENENKSSYFYEKIANAEKDQVFNTLKYNFDEELNKDKIKYITVKEMKDLKYNEISKSQSTDFIKGKEEIHNWENKMNNLFKNKGVKLDKDIVVYRRSREDYEKSTTDFTKPGVTSTTYKDSLPKKMPSGLSFGDKENYIIIPKGTKIVFAEKTIGKNKPTGEEYEKSYKEVRNQHEIMLKPNTQFKYISKTYDYKSGKYIYLYSI